MKKNRSFMSFFFSLFLFDALKLLNPFINKSHVHFNPMKNIQCLLFDVLANQHVSKITIDQSTFYFSLAISFQRHKKAFYILPLKAKESQTNDGKRRVVELLINFIIPSFSHRLLSAFEYFKYYLILSLSFYSRTNSINLIKGKNSDENSN